MGSSLSSMSQVFRKQGSNKTYHVFLFYFFIPWMINFTKHIHKEYWCIKHISHSILFSWNQRICQNLVSSQDSILAITSWLVRQLFRFQKTALECPGVTVSFMPLPPSWNITPAFRFSLRSEYSETESSSTEQRRAHLN